MGTPAPTLSPDVVNQLAQISRQTDNDVVIAMIVIAIVIVSLAVPITILFNKRDKDKLSQYIQRDKMVLDAFGQNARAVEDMTSVLAGLKATLEMSSSRCVECRSDQLRRFDQLIIGQGEIKSKLAILTDRKENENE